MVRDENQFEVTFRKAVSAIEKEYVPGALRFAGRNLPSVKREILLIEDNLSRVWKLGKENPSKQAITEFRRLLRRWYRLNLWVIERYKEHMRKENPKQMHLLDIQV